MMRAILFVCFIISIYGVSAKPIEQDEEVVEPVPFTASWKCEVLWDVVVDTKDYLIDVAWHIVHETTLLDGKDNIPKFILMKIREMPREKYPAFVLGYHWEDDISDVLQDIKKEVCRVADATSLADLEAASGVPLMGVGYMVQPAERKAKLAYISQHTNLLKQKMNDVLSLLADSGYPLFPLQINRDSLMEAVDDFMDAVHALFVNTVEDTIGPEASRELWKEHAKREMEFFNTLVDADSRDEMLEVMGRYSSKNTVGDALDIVFDVAEHRDLYLRAFDLVSEWIAGVTEIGLLDLPVGYGGYEQLYGEDR